MFGRYQRAENLAAEKVYNFDGKPCGGGVKRQGRDFPDPRLETFCEIPNGACCYFSVRRYFTTSAIWSLVSLPS